MNGSEARRESRAGRPKEHFVLHFVGAADIPTPEFRNKTNPYLRAYLASYVSEIDAEQGTQVRLRRISEVVTTPRRLDCQNVTWNSYRDFRMKPPGDAILCVEVLHFTSDPTKPDSLLGKAEIPISRLVEESHMIIPMICTRGDRQKTPKFSVTLARTFVNEEPPTRKVLFLIRHGESKWNEAQSKINITGMLDRDHSLTELGVFQAAELNRRWRSRHEKMLREQEAEQFIAQEAEAAPFSSSMASLFPSVDPVEGAAVDPFGPDPFGPVPIETATTFRPPYPPADTVALGDLLGLDDASPFPCDPNSVPPAPGLCTTPTLLMPAPSSTRKPSVDFLSPTRNQSIPRNSSQNALWDMLNKPMDFSEEQENMQKDIEERKSFDEDEDTGGSSSDSENDFEAVSPRGTPGGRCRKSVKPDPEEGKASAPVEIPVGSGSPQAEVGSYRSTTAELLDNFHRSDVKSIKEDKAAAQRRRDDYIELFLHADRAYSSPLTRALETALVSLEDHPVLKEDGLHLCSVIREVKNIGGLDTVGVETGDGIIRRARQELSHVLKDKRAHELADIDIHVNDTDQVWWTPMASYDSESEQQERVQEFVTFMRYCDGRIPVVVGHSLFFKAFYSKRISKSLMSNRKYLSHNLQKFRLSNASMLAVTVVFGDVGGGCSEASILDADLIFGGGFHGQGGHGNRNSLERKASIALTEANQLAQANAQLASSPGRGMDSDGELPATRDRSGSSAVFTMIGNLHSDFKNKTDALTKGVKKFGGVISETLTDIFEK